MMDFSGPEFVIAIIALSTGGWLVNNWIRAKHGYSLEDEWGGKTERRDNAETQRLQQENKELNTKLAAMHDRMATLEAIVTDRGYQLSEKIEALRDTRAVQADDAGVPLTIAKREKV